MPQRLFSRNVLKLGGGTALGQMLAVIATPLITRLYSPADMGLLGIFMAFAGFAGVGVAFRYDMPIASVRDDREADCLLASSLFLTIPVSMFAGLTMYVMIKNNLLSYRLLPEWSAIAVVFLLVLTGVFTSLRYWSVRHGLYNVLSRALIFQGIGRATVPVFCGLLQAGWIGLLLGEIISRLFGISKMMRAAWPAIRTAVFPFSPDYFSSILRRNWKSPAILLPSSLIDALAVMIPLPIVSYLFGPEAAGQFFLVQRLSSLPSGLIATSVADVFHPAIANAHWNEPGQIREILVKVTRKLALISAMIYVPVTLISPFVFGFVFGEKWRTTGAYMAVLAPLSMVALVVSPVSRLLLVVDKMEIKFIFDVISLLVPIVSIFTMNHFGYNFLSSLGVYAVFHIMANFIYYGLIWRASAVNNEMDRQI